MTVLPDQLHNISFAFEGLDNNEIKRFLEKSQMAERKPHEYLFRETDSPSFVFLILCGEWLTERSLPNGGREVGAFTSVGEFVGFGDVDVYSYGFKALTHGRAHQFAEGDFWQFVKTNPSVQRRLDERRNQKIKDWAERAVVLSKMKAHERLCVCLVKIARLQRTDMTEAQLNMTRQDIADYLGLTSDTVSRGFKKLEDGGLIRRDKSGRHISFLQPNTIEKLAEAI